MDLRLLNHEMAECSVMILGPFPTFIQNNRLLRSNKLEKFLKRRIRLCNYFLLAYS